MKLNYYKYLSKNNKIIFWQIVSNAFLVAFTFWMGLFVQDFIAEKNTKLYEKLNEKLLTIQYTDIIIPQYQELQNNPFFSKLKRFVFETNNRNLDENDVKGFQDLLCENAMDIISMADKSVSTMSRIRYYGTKEDYDSISNNNGKILLYRQLFKMCFADVQIYDEESFKNTLKEFLVSAEMNNSSYMSRNLSSSNIAWDLYKKFKNSESKDSKIMIQALLGNLLEPIINNMEFMEKFCKSPFTQESNKYQLKKEPWIFFLIALFLALIVCFAFAKFAAPANHSNVVSEIDFNKKEQELNFEKRKFEEYLNSIKISNIEIERLTKEKKYLQEKLDEDVAKFIEKNTEISLLKEEINKLKQHII